MNVYQKLATARLKLKEAGLKQSGKNQGLKYTYFDLQDILPQTTKIEQEIGLLSMVSFTETEGTLTVFDTEKPTDTIVFRSPLKEAKVGSCQPVQNLGAMETYVRRYLYLLAYEIVETDALDKGGEEDKQGKIAVKKAAAGQEKSKAKKLQELVAETDIEPQQITDWIINNFGSAIRVNDLTDEQFEMLYTAIERSLKK